MTRNKRPHPQQNVEDLLDLPHEDFSAYCRLCFSINQLEPVYENPREPDYSLISLIELSTGIRLTVKTDYPCSICLQCRLKLEDFRKFRKLCQQLNRIIRRKKLEVVPKAVGAEEVATSNTTNTVEGQPLEDGMMLLEEMAPPDGSIADPAAVGVSDMYYVQEVTENDDIQLTGVTAMQQISLSLPAETEDNVPYIKMANDWYCCKMCSRLSQTMDALAQHFRDLHPTKAHLFGLTNPNSTLKDLELQQIDIKGTTYHKCDLCDTLFLQKRYISRHRARYHATGQEPKYDCIVQNCGCFFMEKKQLGRHMQLIHDASFSNRNTSAKKSQPVEMVDLADDDDDDDVMLVE